MYVLTHRELRILIALVAQAGDTAPCAISADRDGAPRPLVPNLDELQRLWAKLVQIADDVPPEAQAPVAPIDLEHRAIREELELIQRELLRLLVKTNPSHRGNEHRHTYALGRQVDALRDCVRRLTDAFYRPLGS